MVDRTSGNVNARARHQAEARAGRDRSPEDIPKQAHYTRFTSQASNVSAFTQVGQYSIGIPKRPNIVHDNGFLRLGRRGASTEDYLKLAKWTAMLEGAEVLRPDLVDGTAAYRHFLEGEGRRRDFSYERYVMSDVSGKTTLKNAILDIQTAVIDTFRSNPKRSTFSLTGSAITCGGSPTFPYPATENWQKAIGGHTIWLSGNVTVRGTQLQSARFNLDFVLHAEDRYNFNPGQSDITTGIPDSDNGIFEMTGLAHQYDQFATLKRMIVWKGDKLGVISSSGQSMLRQRQPVENRRVRNRL